MVGTYRHMSSFYEQPDQLYVCYSDEMKAKKTVPIVTTSVRKNQVPLNENRFARTGSCEFIYDRVNRIVRGVVECLLRA